MKNSLRAQVENVIRVWATKAAPLSPNDIRMEIGVSGRDKVSSTLSRMAKDNPNLRRSSRENPGSPNHYVYWMEEPVRTPKVVPKAKTETELPQRKWIAPEPCGGIQNSIPTIVFSLNTRKIDLRLDDAKVLYKQLKSMFGS